MASKALTNKKKKEEKQQAKSNRSSSKQKLLDGDGDAEPKKCPVFSVQYLGKTPAGGEYGREFIAEPVETLLRLREKRPKKQPESALHISNKGFHFLDKNGPFGKEKHVLIPIHHICYGVADEQHPHVFAIITRTDSSSVNSLFDCHAFWCGHKKTAQEVTYWLLRTFLQVFNDLQKKRKERQERKLRKQQDVTLGGSGAHNEPVSPSSPPMSPDGVNLAMYSVIFEGPTSKGHGAAVRLTRNRPQTVGNANPTAHRVPPDADYPGTDGLVTNSSSHYQSPPHLNGRPSLAQMRGRQPPPPVTVLPPPPGDYPPDDDDFFKHAPRSLRIVPGRSQSLNTGGSSSKYGGGGGVNGYSKSGQYQQPLLPSAMGPNNNHLLAPPPSRSRYEKKHTTSRSSSAGHSNGSSNGSMTRESSKEGDFIFIDMLQEAFSDAGHSSSGDVSPGAAGGGKNPGRWFRSRKQSGTPSSGGSNHSNPLEKLTSEDIERRIRQWLIEGEEPNNNVQQGNNGGYNESPYSPMHHHHQGPAFRYHHHHQQHLQQHHPGNGWIPPSVPSASGMTSSSFRSGSVSPHHTPLHAINNNTLYGMTADENYF